MKVDIYKYLIATVMLMLWLQSCNKQDNDPDTKAYPILFNSLETRAAASLDDIKADGFRVYAYLQGNTGNSETFEKYVQYNSGQNVWTYDGIQYWIPETQYWFKAFYPTDVSFGSLTVDNTDSGQRYTIKGLDINEQKEVMVATANASVGVGALSPTSGSVVNLKFDHILACVVLKVKSEIDGVSITSVKLSGVRDNATFNGSSWESTNETTIDYTGNTDLVRGADFVDVTGGGILVVPGPTDGVELTINNEDKYTATLTAPTSWEIGKKYTYTVEIKQNDIIFNEPQVKQWDSESATGSVIIK